jgi:hypothetical protein
MAELTATNKPSPADEVRRCAKCQAVAVVCERDWQHTTWGAKSGFSTRDFCCQSCGRRFTLVPMMNIWVQVGFAVLFCWTCVMPLAFGGVAAYRYWPYNANPVVPGAPRPEIRFSAAEPTRRCAACGGVAQCRTVTRRSSRGIPTGTEYEYGCTSCGKAFTLESGGALASASSAPSSCSPSASAASPSAFSPGSSASCSSR